MNAINRMKEERHVFEMPFANQLLLWAVRSWVQGHMARDCCAPLIRQGFEKAGIPSTAFCQLDLILSILAATSRNRIDVRHMRCCRASADEERLLDAIADHQFYSADAVNPPTHENVKAREKAITQRGIETALAPWLPPSALRLCREPASELADSFAYAGLVLQPCNPATAAH